MAYSLSSIPLFLCFSHCYKSWSPKIIFYEIFSPKFSLKNFSFKKISNFFLSQFSYLSPSKESTPVKEKKEKKKTKICFCLSSSSSSTHVKMNPKSLQSSILFFPLLFFLITSSNDFKLNSNPLPFIHQSHAMLPILLPPSKSLFLKVSIS